MKITSMWAVMALVLLSLTQGAMAQDSKIGYVNTQRITTESAIAKAAQAKLEQEFSKRGKELADLQSALKTFSEKFERDAPTLTDSQRASRQKEGAELNRDFQRKQREYQEDLNGRRNEELQQVLEKANKAVKKVAEDEKYDLVIQEVVYSNSRHDITDKVLKILNAAGK
jgi:outer membrane protein